MGYQTSDNVFSPTKFIVDAVAQEGVFTTIQAAINAATYGTDIFIRPGTYTENITLKDGVNLTAFTRDVNIVQINGTITMNTAGTVNISGITVQTNGATAVSFSSANLQNLTFTNCVLTSTNADLITNSNSNSSSVIIFQTCNLTAALTYKILVGTFTGIMNFRQTGILGASTTASTSTGGNLFFVQGNTNQAFSLTGTAIFTAWGWNAQATNFTLITLATGTKAFFYGGRLASGSAFLFNITTTGEVYCFNVALETSAATINTGTGTFYNGSNAYLSTVAVTSTNSALVGTAFTRVNVQTFTGNGTYTPTAGMKSCTVEIVGGGGGGGGSEATGAAQYAAGAGGAGGGYSRETYSAATIGASQTVTIGAGGAAGAASAATAGTGGTTSFGALMSATGGAGGNGGAATGTGNIRVAGNAGVGSGGDINISGQAGGYGIVAYSSVVMLSGYGGASYFGYGFRGSQGAPTAGQNYGSGASGRGNLSSLAAAAGAAGAAGFCIVTEFI
jgi:hypothetical protein